MELLLLDHPFLTLEVLTDVLTVNYFYGSLFLMHDVLTLLAGFSLCERPIPT